MTRQDKIKAHMKLLVEASGGKHQFNYKETANLLNVCPRTLPRILNDNGVLVTRLGHRKLVAAADIASIMFARQECPIDDKSH